MERFSAFFALLRRGPSRCYELAGDTFFAPLHAEPVPAGKGTLFHTIYRESG